MDCKLDDFFDENANQTLDNYNYLKNKVIGHYGIYEMYQEKRKFSYGVLSIIKSPVDGHLKAYAIFQIRNDNDMDQLKKYAKNYQSFGAKIVFLETPNFSVSSSELRDRIAQGKTVRYQLPDAVIEYIRTHHLYQA